MNTSEIRSVMLDGDGSLPDGPFVGLIDGAMVPLLLFVLPKGLKGHARRDVAMRQLRDQIGGSAKDVEVQPFQGANPKALLINYLRIALPIHSKMRTTLEFGLRTIWTQRRWK